MSYNLNNPSTTLSFISNQPKTGPIRTGTWQPLPHIYSGFVIYPFHPSVSLPNSPTSNEAESSRQPFRHRFSWSGVQGLPIDDNSGKSNPYEISLDVGDEFFAFEEYECTIDEDGRGDVWYRGYVVQAVSLQLLAPSTTSSNPSTNYPRPEPSVLIGIFPSSVVHVRPGAPNDNGELAPIYEKARKAAIDLAKETANRGREMEAVIEEEGEYSPTSPKRSIGTLDVISPSKTNGLRPNRPQSLILDKVGQDENKAQPPLPKLTAGDATLAGQQWPLVDEIACAIREWYGRLPTYLVNRDYRLFNAVMQHIDALFLGRRQLLAQTLSGDELSRVRKECVSRLVKCNVAQGLEVIVRSLEDGSVMVVDQERAVSGASWISGITCYVYQLAYIDLIPLDMLFGKTPSLLTPSPLGTVQPVSMPPSRSTPYNCCLDVRAFVASPCAPGETAELFFSLYNKVESRFVTEEFCLVLNHLGSPARDGEQRLGRLRTLFTDLKQEDVTETIYLVCKLVRNGAMKMNSVASSGASEIRTRKTLGESLGPYRGSITTLDNISDDSFSVTSGYGRGGSTIETATVHGGNAIGPTFRRPLGCAVLELAQLSKMMEENHEFTMPIFVPREEGAFATLHEDIIHDRIKEFEKSPRAESIAVSLRVFRGAASQLIQEHPSLLHDVPLSARLGFPDVVYPNDTRNDLYIKLWSASFSTALPSSGSIRNVRRSVAATNQGNVQATLEVRTMDGTLIPDAIHAGGSGEYPMSQFNSLVFYHNDRPTFGELVKIQLPPHVDCHLFFTFRSRTRDQYAGHDLERPFAIAFLPLYSTTTCIKDGLHNLILYRMEKNAIPSPSIYLDAPAVEPSTLTKSMIPLKDRMVLRSFLCSSSHTQDDTLRSLFSWQQYTKDIPALCSILQLFAFVPEEELSKFVPKSLDSLFGILVANLETQTQVNNLVFQALVKILSMTSDRRFPNFDSVLDVYISEQFHYPASSFHLLSSMKSVMSNPSTQEYRSFLKVWHLFFRFIIRARELDRAKGIGLDATSAHLEADFQRQTKGILAEINNLMKSTDKAVIGTQTLAVQHYSDILPHLAQVFPPLEIAEMVIAFADTLSSARGSIAIYKLLLLLQIIKSVFNTSDSRSLLVPAMVRWVRPHLGRYEEVNAQDAGRIKWLECNRLAITVIAWTVNKLQEWHASPLIQGDDSLRSQEDENLEYCLTLLPSLLASYDELAGEATASVLSRHQTIWKATPDVFPMTHPFALIAQLPPESLLERHQHANDDGLPSPETFKCGLAEAGVVILTLVLACPATHLSRWLEESLEVDGIESFSRTLMTTFEFCRSIIRFDAFPKQWLTLSLMSFSSIIKLLTSVANLMDREQFIPPIQDTSGFNVELWTGLFELLCEFCGSEELALEEQTQQRRRAEWIIAGDLRDEGAALLLRLWNAIGWPLMEVGQGGVYGDLRYGGYQTRFTALAERILGLCLSSHDQMCETAVEILFSMIYAEYVLEGKFDTIETEIFAKLDKLFSQKSSSDPTMRAYFVAQLRAVFEGSPEIDASFHQKVATFLDEIELFIDLLLSLRDLPESNEWKDERSAATYRLMDFIKRIGRNDLYIRFIHQLVQINIECRDWLGAGLALKIHADMLEWTTGGELLDEFEDGALSLPRQTNFARKETLYRYALGYLVDAEAYEIALELSQELVQQHQKLTYNHTRVVELLQYQAGLWEKIGSTSRHYPEYFRIVSCNIGLEADVQAFYGPFPSMVKNKEFIIRGRPWQKYADFYESIQHKYPEATLHRQKTPPIEIIRNGPDQIIWVTVVQPSPDLSQPVFSEPGVSENVQSYWRNNGLNKFTSSRPYYRDPEDNEPVLQWVEKATLTTAEKLPHVLSRSEVIDIAFEHVSPISTAIDEVEKATLGIQQLAKRYRGLAEKVQNPDTKTLDGVLQAAVSSPVQGGVALYRRTFLESDYLDRHPSEAVYGNTLRSGILDYVGAIQEALAVHRSLCGPKMISFNEALERLFAKSFLEEIAVLPKPSRISMSNGHATSPTTSVSPSNLTRSLSKASKAPVKSPAKTSPTGAPMLPHSTTPFILPPLRLGPSPGSSAIGNHRSAPGIPVTTNLGTSSPKISITSNDSSEKRRSSDISSSAGPGIGIGSPSKSGGSGSGSQQSHNSTAVRPSYGNRTLSLVESLSGKGNRRSVVGNGEGSLRSASPLSRDGSEGTIGELKEETGKGRFGGGSLRRWGSLLKRP